MVWWGFYVVALAGMTDELRVEGFTCLLACVNGWLDEYMLVVSFLS